MTTSSSPHAATSLTETIAAKVGDATEAALNQVRSAASSAAELRGRGGAAEFTQEGADGFRSTLSRFLQGQPLVALAGAAILGFILGALCKLAR